MTKKDIVKQIASELNVSQNLVYEIVQRTFDGITDALVKERRIELRNFGVFEIRLRAPRKARNPRTNERVDVPERVAVSFKAGKEMAQRITAIQPDDLAGAAQKPTAPGRAALPPQADRLSPPGS